MNSKSSAFKEEQERLMDQIWSFINIEGCTVLDIGIGEDAITTKRLIKLGGKVIVIDKDEKMLKKHQNLKVPLLCYDVNHLVFKRRFADLTVFYFTLHEINPAIHENILSRIAQISSKIMIVEPSPGRHPIYQRYEKIWRSAMHAIGLFEDYHPRSYWTDLIEKSGFKTSVSKQLVQHQEVPQKILENIFQSFIKDWKEIGVPRRYLDQMYDVLDIARATGMLWSDLIVVIGEIT